MGEGDVADIADVVNGKMSFNFTFELGQRNFFDQFNSGRKRIKLSDIDKFFDGLIFFATDLSCFDSFSFFFNFFDRGVLSFLGFFYDLGFVFDDFHIGLFLDFCGFFRHFGFNY